MEPIRHQLEVDGLRLSFLEQGTPQRGRPTLVLLHGLMGSSETFRPLLAALEADQHVIALDLPGAGFSERREGLSASLRSIARLVQKALAALCLSQSCVLGHSHGGSVALSLAQIAPSSLDSLILLAPAHPYFDEGDPLIRFYLTLPGRLFAYSLPWFPKFLHRIGLRRMAGRHSMDHDELLRPYRENLRTPGTIRHLLTLLRSWHKDMAWLDRELAPSLRQPTLLLWGDRDRAVPHTSASKLRQRLFTSELRILEGIGHRPAEECPAEVAQHIERFFQQRAFALTAYDSLKVAPSQTFIAPLMTPSFDSGD